MRNLALLISTLLASLLAPHRNGMSDKGTAENTSPPPDVNLALHLPYQVKTSIVDSHMRRIEENNFPDTGGLLTDGNAGESSWQFRGAWLGFLCQDRHDVFVDLGAARTLHKLDAWFLQDKSAGIRFPHDVSFAVSNDNVLWHGVGTARTRVRLCTKGIIRQQYAVEALNVSARYVRYTFYTDVWVLTSEVEAWGQTQSHGATLSPIPAVPPQRQAIGFPAAGSAAVGGKRREVLIYNGFYRKAGFGQWTTDDFLPYVAYLNQRGRVQDYMFDSFLFLPFHNAPSGGKYGLGTATKTDWQYYASQLFRPDFQLSALDRTVRTVRRLLPLRRYQARVVIAIPYPGTMSHWSHDLDFDPKRVGPKRSLENRLAAVRWYVDTIRDRWNKAHFRNITLSGFYWLPEHVPYGRTPDEEALIRGVGRIVHDAGNYTFDWIPYNQSEGFRRWAVNDFDNALMQPNYAWGAGKDRLNNTALLAREYGLGIEMELDWTALATTNRGMAARKIYTEYLNTSYRHHYADSFLAWYQGYRVLAECEESSIPIVRQVYDETHAFIRSQYTPHWETMQLLDAQRRYLAQRPRGELPIGTTPDYPNPEAEDRLRHPAHPPHRAARQ